MFSDLRTWAIACAHTDTHMYTKVYFTKVGDYV